jgi:hypothetical protein
MLYTFYFTTNVMKQQLISKQERLFRKASEILRNTKLPQTYGTLTDHKGRFCALGAIYAELGWDGQNLTWDADDFHIIDEQLGFSTIINSEYGTTMTQGVPVVQMNDNEHKSFLEIADYLESKGL